LLIEDSGAAHAIERERDAQIAAEEQKITEQAQAVRRNAAQTIGVEDEKERGGVNASIIIDRSEFHGRDITIGDNITYNGMTEEQKEAFERLEVEVLNAIKMRQEMMAEAGQVWAWRRITTNLERIAADSLDPVKKMENMIGILIEAGVRQEAQVFLERYQNLMIRPQQPVDHKEDEPKVEKNEKLSLFRRVLDRVTRLVGHLMPDPVEKMKIKKQIEDSYLIEPEELKVEEDEIPGAIPQSSTSEGGPIGHHEILVGLGENLGYVEDDASRLLESAQEAEAIQSLSQLYYQIESLLEDHRRIFPGLPAIELDAFSRNLDEVRPFLQNDQRVSLEVSHNNRNTFLQNLFQIGSLLENVQGIFLGRARELNPLLQHWSQAVRNYQRISENNRGVTLYGRSHVLVPNHQNHIANQAQNAPRSHL
jgi:hypothetical protein